MANVPSDHSSAEIDPGSPAPLVEGASGGAEQGGGNVFGAGTPAGVLPNAVVPIIPPFSTQPIPGQNEFAPAQGATPVVARRPQTIVQGEPPLAKGWGVDNTIIIGKTNQLPHDYGSAGAQVAAAQQANVTPFVAVPILSRMGGDTTSWAIVVQIAGQSKINIRGTYRDLKIQPGIRGIQLQYGTAAGAVQVVENATGMVYTFVTGPKTIFAPLFMLREVFDLTIYGPGGIAAPTAFPAGATCMLTTEEQIPFQF